MKELNECMYEKVAPWVGMHAQPRREYLDENEYLLQEEVRWQTDRWIDSKDDCLVQEIPYVYW